MRWGWGMLRNSAKVKAVGTVTRNFRKKIVHWSVASLVFVVGRRLAAAAAWVAVPEATLKLISQVAFQFLSHVYTKLCIVSFMATYGAFCRFFCNALFMGIAIKFHFSCSLSPLSLDYEIIQTINYIIILSRRRTFCSSHSIKVKVNWSVGFKATLYCFSISLSFVQQISLLVTYKNTHIRRQTVSHILHIVFRSRARDPAALRSMAIAAIMCLQRIPRNLNQNSPFLRFVQ